MSGLRAAFALTTIAPVGSIALDRQTCNRIVPWLPAVGAIVGGCGAVLAMLCWHGNTSGSPLLGATLTVAFAQAATRGLHIDGLADTADGLGSGKAPREALEIMKRSDIGPFGVTAIVATLFLQVTSLTAIFTYTSLPVGFVDAALIGASGRLAIVLATGVKYPAARPHGLGALLAQTVTRRQQILVFIATIGVACSALVALKADAIQVAAVAGAVTVSNTTSVALGKHCIRRFGGITGDIYGALLETTATLTAVIIACTLTYNT